jgi:2-dehydro-3-deoxy-D-gluconate 5-dehydrogenase
MTGTAGSDTNALGEPRSWGHTDGFSLQDKVALVTGGNRGIGRAIALGFLAAGAAVVVTGRDESQNAAVENELGRRGLVFRADVRDESAMERVVAETCGRLGHLDVLVNNAGIGGLISVLDMSQADWREMLDTHLTGTFHTSKFAARWMIERGEGGSIINMGSMYSVFGPPKLMHYAAAKAGVLGLTRALAVELAPHRIRVNALLPGWIATDMTSAVRATDLGEVIRRKIPLGYFGTPDEVVGAALLLASAAGQYITGSEIAVDGGYHVADLPMGLLL